jgi:hypothetical protein
MEGEREGRKEEKERRKKGLFFLCFLILHHKSVCPVALGLWWGSTSWQEHMAEQNHLPHGQEAKERGVDWSLTVPFRGTVACIQWPKGLLLSLTFFFLWYWGLNSGSTPWATPPATFCDGSFQYRVLWTICLGWFWTVILLISASWVARIIGLSHQCPTFHDFLM